MATLTAAPAATGPATRTALSRWTWAAGLGAGAAGVLHVAAAADHVAMGGLVVGFFLLTALAQIGTAAWLVIGSWAGSRPRPDLVAMALAGTVALVALYVVAHTTDLLSAFGIAGSAGDAGAEGDHLHADTMTRFDPVTGVDFLQGMSTESGATAMDGEAASTAHQAGPLGTATVAAELVAVVGLTALLPRSWRGRALNALLVLGGAAWLLWFLGVLG
jgi:hypothetical protein